MPPKAPAKDAAPAVVETATAPSDMERVFPIWDTAAVDADLKAAVTGACRFRIRGLHSFPFPLKFSSLCLFPLNLSLLCPPHNPK
jgi:hypothetical protein